MTLQSDIQKLAPSSAVELFVLDAGGIGGSVSRFHAGTNELSSSVVWQGETYLPWPVKFSGLEWSGEGQPPRPRMAIGNKNGLVSALILNYQDLVGAQVTRKKTLVKYLDAANFAAGNAGADPAAHWPDQTFTVKRKVREDDVVEWELGTLYDVQGVMLPLRPVIATCWWRYRSAECSYAGSAYFTAADEPTADPDADVCGKRISSCKARFGTYAELPFGGQPSAGLVT